MCNIIELKKLITDIKTNIKVNNVNETSANFIFIMESPHTDEIINHDPLMGNAGKYVSEIILGKTESQPFGKAIKSHKKKYGIVETSFIPLQISKILKSIKKHEENQSNEIFFKFKQVKTIFAECYTNDNINKLGLILKEIRDNASQSIESMNNNTVKDQITLFLYNEYKRTLDNIKNSNNNPKFIVCGKVAKAFFTHYNKDNNLSYIYNRYPIIYDENSIEVRYWDKNNEENIDNNKKMYELLGLDW